MGVWSTVLELDSGRRVTSGSTKALVAALSRGADLRIGTEFVHNQHIDIDSSCNDRIVEVAEFGVTYVIDNRWAGGVMTLRQPIQLPDGFGPRPSMSFFLYNQDGQQAIARPYLDGLAPRGAPGPASLVGRPAPGCDPGRYSEQSVWDQETNAPSCNFIYDFDVYRYSVGESWREVYRHEKGGRPTSGSLDDLVAAFAAGCELKVGITGLCFDLAAALIDEPLPHEVFIQAGPGYYYQNEKVFLVGTHPLVRVAPAIPLLYQTGNWDFGWAMARTDGQVVYRRCDPYTLRFEDQQLRCDLRWFVRE